MWYIFNKSMQEEQKRHVLNSWLIPSYSTLCYPHIYLMAHISYYEKSFSLLLTNYDPLYSVNCYCNRVISMLFMFYVCSKVHKFSAASFNWEIVFLILCKGIQAFFMLRLSYVTCLFHENFQIKWTLFYQGFPHS